MFKANVANGGVHKFVQPKSSSGTNVVINVGYMLFFKVDSKVANILECQIHSLTLLDANLNALSLKNVQIGGG